MSANVTDDNKHFKVLKKIQFPKVKVISADDFVELLIGVRPEKRERLSKKKSH